jgi:hypothetical protein
VLGEAPLRGLGVHRGVREQRQAAAVVVVQVGDHHVGDLFRVDPDGGQAVPSLLAFQPNTGIHHPGTPLV